MAITQISRITNRKGLQIDLPLLAGAELGWSVDERRLWIGNGEIAEGAPVVGNTEILTEFSDILKLNASYTYEGTAGYIPQTGPTADSPVSMSVQSWMDQWVTVKDFGATGDGFTDDTAAINRALYEIYCRDIHPQARKAIYFPAGVYRVTGSILVPPYATLYGEGADNTIIQLDSGIHVDYVMRTTDNHQEYGVNIGSNAAVLPQSVSISNMTLSSLERSTNLLLLEDVNIVRINSVRFKGCLTDQEIVSDTYNSAGIRFKSNNVLITNSVSVNDCEFTNLTYGVTSLDIDRTKNGRVKGVTINESKLTNLYQGVVIGNVLNNTLDSYGFRITNNVFDNIYTQGIFIGFAELNVSAHNIFYDVGNYLLGLENPYTAVIEIFNNNNVSLGDLFARTDDFADLFNPGSSYPRVMLHDTTSIAITNSQEIAIGTYVRQSGNTAILLDQNTLPTPVINQNGKPVVVSTLITPAFVIDYTIVRGSSYRTGSISATALGNSTSLTWDDNYIQNDSTGIQLSLIENNDQIILMYTSDAALVNGDLSYSIRSFSVGQYI